MLNLQRKSGARIFTNTRVTEINVSNGKVQGGGDDKRSIKADVVINSVVFMRHKLPNSLASIFP